MSDTAESKTVCTVMISRLVLICFNTNKFHYKAIYALEPTAVTWLSLKVRYDSSTWSESVDQFKMAAIVRFDISVSEKRPF